MEYVILLWINVVSYFAALEDYKGKTLFDGGIMFYPESFKVRVKDVYPNSENLHQLLDEEKDIVGAYLAMHRSSITIDAILSATSLEELQAAAKVAKKREELWNEWRRLFEEQYCRDC